MKTFCLDAPVMYGDHHVVEVRRILLELSGVVDVYASSAFHAVEVTYDPDLVTEAVMTECLEAAGYLGETDHPVEMGATAYHAPAGELFFRHTVNFETTRQVVSFAQNTPFRGRPLWPCPGMGAISKKEG